MGLNWKLNTLEETAVVSLVLLLVIRSVGDISVISLLAILEELLYNYYKLLLQ